MLSTIEVILEPLTTYAPSSTQHSWYPVTSPTPAPTLSTSSLDVFLAIIMILVALLAGAVLIAFHLLRRTNEINEDKKKEAAAYGNKNPNDAKDDAPSRFPALSAIDAALKQAQPTIFQSSTLQDICTDFQQYAAYKHKLYYDIKDVRRFIAGMGISKLILLRGMSGTGKTSLAYVAGEYFCNPSTVVPIQPMWKERSDMIGYFNEFTKKFNETTMLCKLYEAGGKDDIYITVLDEVNIARIEYYFAEFLSLLELPEHRRYLDVVSDSWEHDPERLEAGRLLLPPNMWFVGTANNDDSTFAISDKVYDRAAVLDLDKKCSPFIADKTMECHISYSELTALFEQAKTDYSLSAEGRKSLLALDKYLGDTFRIGIGNRMIGQIERYVPIMLACGATEAEALDDMIARKILRKLEQLNPAFVRSQADALIAKLQELFKSPELSKQYVALLKNTL